MNYGRGSGAEKIRPKQELLMIATEVRPWQERYQEYPTTNKEYPRKEIMVRKSGTA